MSRARLLPVVIVTLAPAVVWPQGDPVGPEFQINTYALLHQFDPSVARDSAGNFVVVWESDAQDGSGFGIFGQRYSQIVPIELTHFRVE